jgi:Flp pilus assembly protein TadG
MNFPLVSHESHKKLSECQQLSLQGIGLCHHDSGYTMRDCRIRLATKRVYKAGLLKALKRNESCRGQTLVEFALVSMSFFLLAFALIDFSWLLFNQMNMQDAVREAGRYAATGQHLPDPNNPGNSLSRIASITQTLNSLKVGANIDSLVISSANGGVGSAGGPSDTVTIKAQCDLPLLTTAIGKFFGSDNKFHFTVSSTFKNEPFPSSETN